MGESIKNAVYIAIGLIASYIVTAYAFYFIGMVMSLAANPALGVQGEQLAQIFAWIGVGVTTAVFVFIIALVIKENGDRTNVVYLDGEEIVRSMFRDAEDDN